MHPEKKTLWHCVTITNSLELIVQGENTREREFVAFQEMIDNTGFDLWQSVRLPVFLICTEIICQVIKLSIKLLLTIYITASLITITFYRKAGELRCLEILEAVVFNVKVNYETV